MAVKGRKCGYSMHQTNSRKNIIFPFKEKKTVFKFNASLYIKDDQGKNGFTESVYIDNFLHGIFYVYKN